jgi:hypothetical protein
MSAETLVEGKFWGRRGSSASYLQLARSSFVTLPDQPPSDIIRRPPRSVQ